MISEYSLSRIRTCVYLKTEYLLEKEVNLVTIKKLCDGLDISLEEFFSGPEFKALEQEIR